jgi:Flp pilus assembly protein TadD
MSLKGTRKSAREIGRELGVRYVLEGSVRKAGINLRITAQLIDAATDTNRWAEKYSGVLDDVFDLQERVSREIVRALDVTLSTAEDRSLARRSIADATAYDCYLRARHELARASADSLDRATALLNRGIEIVGENSLLRATLLYVDVLRIRTAGHIDATVLDAVGEQARDILHREPDSGSALLVLGMVDFERGRLQKASASMRSALSVDPHDVDAAIWLGIIYLYAGQMEAARATFDRLRGQDPLSPFPLGLSSVAEWMDGNFASGLPAMAKCLELSPESTIWRWHWGYLLALAGRLGEASEQAEHLQRTDPENPYSRHLLALTRAVRGDTTGAREAIAPCDNDNLDPHMTFHVAECYALIREDSRAIELMLRAVQRGFYPHAFIARYNPFIDRLRADPRFEQIARESERRWLEFVI